MAEPTPTKTEPVTTTAPVATTIPVVQSVPATTTELLKPIVPLVEPPVKTAPQVQQNPFKFNKIALNEHIDKVLDNLDKYNGKRKHNPHYYIESHVRPLHKRLNGYSDEDGKTVAPEETQELHEAVMALDVNYVPIVMKQDAAVTQEDSKPKIQLGPVGQKIVRP